MGWIINAWLWYVALPQRPCCFSAPTFSSKTNFDQKTHHVIHRQEFNQLHHLKTFNESDLEGPQRGQKGQNENSGWTSSDPFLLGVVSWSQHQHTWVFHAQYNHEYRTKKCFCYGWKPDIFNNLTMFRSKDYILICRSKLIGSFAERFAVFGWGTVAEWFKALVLR